ncbi:MAG: valine--tRNA ligase [Chloroflexi bacterium]|nr:valine--tRNA ligase [Chloroflexota bacterium]
MSLSKRYNPIESEPDLEARWQAEGIYHFDPESGAPVFSIDTPPPTVSGHLHLGHVYSYSHADFIARYRRMKGFNVYYPMGFDDNGLPTERLVEKRQKVTAAEIGRQAFIERCLQVSEAAERDYRALWQRLGLSIDWRQTYRTIDARSRRCSQLSFIDLYRKGLAYRSQSPAIWCPECRTAIAQADLEDRARATEFVTLPFRYEDGSSLAIATTRPELLAACVAVFVHPDDARYAGQVGRLVTVPLYGHQVPILTDPAADPEKGTGAVMCCTFGDQTDVSWWLAHRWQGQRLPLITAIDESGRMTAAANSEAAGELAGLPVETARARIKEALEAQGLILARQPVEGTLRVHERCDTPVEYRILSQWFIRILENKQKFLELGEQVQWHPAHMHARYKAWVENLSWDWCISRQRYFGVAFPLWYCKDCGETILADESQLPVDPLSQSPSHPCPACGSTAFTPESDVMDTWATSSLTAQIVTGWLDQPHLFERLFPVTLRPQAHEIIRTWAFYSIVKSYYHFGKLPWSNILISGWGIAGEGMGKISKSKGGGPLPPMEMIQRYSADAVRYWAASTVTGKDSVISEEKIQMGAKLVTKLWNVARFAEQFLSANMSQPPDDQLTPADRWILSGCRRMVQRVTAAFEAYEYAAAKNEIENFFWRDLADNYLEMAKSRLYDEAHTAHTGACYTLATALKTLLKLLAPLLPFVTDAIWRELFAAEEGIESIHRAGWPAVEAEPDPDDLALGEALIALASAVRRYKSERSLSLGSELPLLQIAARGSLANRLSASISDVMSVTRACSVVLVEQPDSALTRLQVDHPSLQVAIRG